MFDMFDKERPSGLDMLVSCREHCEIIIIKNRKNTKKELQPLYFFFLRFCLNVFGLMLLVLVSKII